MFCLLRLELSLRSCQTPQPDRCRLAALYVPISSQQWGSAVIPSKHKSVLWSKQIEIYPYSHTPHRSTQAGNTQHSHKQAAWTLLLLSSWPRLKAVSRTPQVTIHAVINMHIWYMCMCNIGPSRSWPRNSIYPVAGPWSSGLPRCGHTNLGALGSSWFHASWWH